LIGFLILCFSLSNSMASSDADDNSSQPELTNPHDASGRGGLTYALGGLHFVVDSRVELVRKMKHYAAQEGRPSDWMWLAPSLQRWWMQAQMIGYLASRVDYLERGVNVYGDLQQKSNQRIIKERQYYDERYGSKATEKWSGEQLAEAQAELKRLEEREYEDQERERDRQDKRLLQLCAIDKLLKEEQAKLQLLTERIKPSEVSARKEDNLMRRGEKRKPPQPRVLSKKRQVSFAE